MSTTSRSSCSLSTCACLVSHVASLSVELSLNKNVPEDYLPDEEGEGTRVPSSAFSYSVYNMRVLAGDEQQQEEGEGEEGEKKEGEEGQV